MKSKRLQFLGAGALLLATAVAGLTARGGVGFASVPRGPGKTVAVGDGPVRFTATLDRTAVLRGQDGTARLELVISALRDAGKSGERRPTDLAIVLDGSGSMQGDKIEYARAAVGELLAQLGPEDRFALVTYSDAATLTVPLSRVDDGGREHWHETVSRIFPNGGTNMSSGLDLGIDVVERARGDGRVPHVILISDGLANQGDPSLAGLTQRAQRAARGEYMLSTVGVGADFNESLMSALADAGTGNYYYLENAASLAEVFARELGAARATVVSGLAVQIDPAAGVNVVDAAGYPLERNGSSVVFRPGSLFEGQERRIWVTLGFPHDTLGEYEVGRLSLSYGADHERRTLHVENLPRIACVEGEEKFYSRLDVDAWSRSVIVDAYNRMQEEVAQAVKAGRRDEALHHVREFREHTAEMNEHLQSAPVGAQLDRAGKLERDVAAAFEGEDQGERQNLLSKSAGAEAIDARRAGSKLK